MRVCEAARKPEPHAGAHCLVVFCQVRGGTNFDEELTKEELQFVSQVTAEARTQNRMVLSLASFVH